MNLMTKILIEGLCLAIDVGARAARRGLYLAGRAVGAAEQLRDVAAVAAMPLEMPTMRWRAAARYAWGGLRGYDLSPILKVRNLNRNVRREVALDHEQRLRAHFASTRERAEA